MIENRGSGIARGSNRQFERERIVGAQFLAKFDPRARAHPVRADVASGTERVMFEGGKFHVRLMKTW